mmetsp:Transcript_39523/g.92972  ORF Transcript_39523/g.92972 Transcript_39523/m.92972 type:complete len:327 (+) Transcript_39523:126-1106(+)|eukprot:CAMPEP_0178409336 /NCGR_PEP_ID=MMETSP0689_2-20121128/20410_1 /TAXON_ID=160604 /ORGANISM="Amphidinium massartii, Strain CS-259" /LENGTH=326 /DNA_ID=CAMNT_0020030475 /DNA_START=84 /DNA_END=1064 /DNA_ORIENTATION=+
MIGRPVYGEFHKANAEMISDLPALGVPYGSLSPPPPQRTRMNGLGFAAAVLCPWFMFTLVCLLVSMEVHDQKPEIVYFCVGLSLIVPVLFGIRLYHMKLVQGHDRSSSSEQTWMSFMTASMVLATAVGFGFGFANYRQNMAHYADYMNLASYTGVDPSRAEGGAYLDAGAIVFNNETTIDYARSIGFKDDRMYCVAPITAGNYKLASYDFWAVGVDCCSGFPGGFGCFDDSRHLDGHPVRSGRRFMEPIDYQRYFRLAVNQAEVEFGFSSKHPVFFYWEQDPQNVIQSYWWNGFHWCCIGIALYLVFQFAIALLVLLKAAKKQNKM